MYKRQHPILRQVAARQRSRHLQLPELAVRLDQAAQHAVHLPIAPVSYTHLRATPVSVSQMLNIRAFT